MTCCGIKLFIFFLVLSVALLAVSLVLIFKIFPDLIDSEIKKNFELKEDTNQYDRFEQLPFSMDFKVYIFNVENPNEITNNGAKPIVKEIGPFVYRQNRTKTIYDTNEEEDTISYTQDLTFEFDQEASGNLSDTDMVTVLNAPMMSMLQIAESMGMSLILGECIKDAFVGYEELFITVPVKDLLFDGINFCNMSLNLCFPINGAACAIAASKRNIDKLEDGSLNFSFLNFKARENDGYYTVMRGMNDISTVGEIIRWNNKTHTEFWGGENSTTTCDEVKGCDATIYPPHADEDTVFRIYSTEICRYVEIFYKGEASYKDVDGYLFEVKEDIFKAHSNNSEDDCFCVHQTMGLDGKKSCFLDGVIDIQPCFGVPVVLSLPHFLSADPIYQNGVIGVKPDEEKHKIFLLVEPNTGTPLQGAKRIQLNSILRPVSGIAFTQYLPRAVLPLVWVEEGVSLPQKYVDELNDLYFSKVNMVNIIQWVLLAVSTVLVVAFGGIILKRQCC